MDIAALRLYKQTGDLLLRNTLVSQNMPLVYDVCWKYQGRFAKELRPDLVNTGVIGLIVAIEKFDISKQLDDRRGLFYVFARWRILHELQCNAADERGIPNRMYNNGVTDYDAFEILTGQCAHHAHTRSPASLVAARLDLGSHLANMDPHDLELLWASAEGASGSSLSDALGWGAEPAARRAAESLLASALERAREAAEASEAADHGSG